MVIDRKLMTALGGGVALLSLTLGSTPAVAQTGPGDAGRGPALNNAAPGSATPSDDTIRKVGGALRDVAGIQSNYGQQMQLASPDQRQQLSQQAEQEEVAAVQRHGLSVDQFDQVVQTARADPTVHQRLLAAAGAR
ncbi:MAG TPA: DUF4168 domain-containing protein [Acetobacteraceae bacterium]|jgi:hypothetical protein